ncbi:toxin-antitoxin system TumE family protein [Desulfonatronospira thiodismutans]|nr:DUF6516 family protein [Desulfonatronospira thiodismutans]
MLDFLAKRKNSSFPERKPSVSASGNKEFPDGNYLHEVRSAIERMDLYGFADVIDIQEELRAGKQAVIQASVVLVDGSSLHVREYIDAAYGIKKVSYGYHYQDRHGKLVFRYDNARHKPALKSKEHKHLSDNSIVEAAAPSISELVEEVVSFL